jgi:hypothetical protein
LIWYINYCGRPADRQTGKLACLFAFGILLVGCEKNNTTINNGSSDDTGTDIPLPLGRDSKPTLAAQLYAAAMEIQIFVQRYFIDTSFFDNSLMLL